MSTGSEWRHIALIALIIGVFQVFGCNALRSADFNMNDLCNEARQCESGLVTYFCGDLGWGNAALVEIDGETAATILETVQLRERFQLIDPEVAYSSRDRIGITLCDEEGMERLRVVFIGYSRIMVVRNDERWEAEIDERTVKALCEFRVAEEARLFDE